MSTQFTERDCVVRNYLASTDSEEDPLPPEYRNHCLQIVSIPNGPCEGNCYVVWDEAHPEDAILIDPGEDAPLVVQTITEKGLKISGIYATHGHGDHIDCISALLDSIGDVPVHIHIGDKGMIRSQMEERVKQGKAFNLQLLTSNEEIHVGERVGKCIHTPGHSEGSCCFLFDKVLFSGDTLFRRGIGRTDFKGGDAHKMVLSLNRLFALDPHTGVLPGHDARTSIMEETLFR
ncbi:MBL fold metallo-hydrolase like protein [Blastocystis sp. ATCC 50177/Nand II]|uniref:MBL fold metallo-hydrolase like protein n=1 Tax=Blastocystis sp. subtype 1 (strain ATCC 50177 / NandII) TaxID=478820 RepID=A0A196S6M6_BLAHN|nr:MBL fold metallo-hydrolase like protein [Blastocystis sp. ATCC 50177/Nand II]